MWEGLFVWVNVMIIYVVIDDREIRYCCEMLFIEFCVIL